MKISRWELRAKGIRFWIQSMLEKISSKIKKVKLRASFYTFQSSSNGIAKTSFIHRLVVEKKRKLLYLMGAISLTVRIYVIR